MSEKEFDVWASLGYLKVITKKTRVKASNEKEAREKVNEIIFGSNGWDDERLETINVNYGDENIQIEEVKEVGQ